MDKIYSAQDVANVIAKVEELAGLNAELEELLYRGCNNEKLVDRKRELENSLRKYKSIVLDSEDPFLKDPEVDGELSSLRFDFDNIVSRYKEKKRELQTAIRVYTNGN
jgi:hypothetical protein